MAAPPRDPNKRWYLGINNLQFGSGDAPKNGGRSVGRTAFNKTNIVEQDELIGTFQGSTPFFTRGFVIQPGDSAVFPFLSAIASQYQRYKFLGLTFYWKPIVTAYSAAGQSGQAALSCDFDAGGGDPTSMRVVEATDPHTVFMPYMQGRLDLDPRRLTPVSQGLYVRNGPVPPGQDPKTFDAGRVFLSFYGVPLTDADIGELHVAYRVMLLNPLLKDLVAPNPMPRNFTCSWLVGAVSDYPVEQVQNNPVSWSFYQSINGLGLTLEPDGSGNLKPVLQPGMYQLTVLWQIVSTIGFTDYAIVPWINGSPAAFPAGTFEAYVSGAPVTLTKQNTFTYIVIVREANTIIDLGWRAARPISSTVLMRDTVLHIRSW
jgi:hypothetical protein